MCCCAGLEKCGTPFGSLPGYHMQHRIVAEAAISNPGGSLPVLGLHISCARMDIASHVCYVC